MDSADASHIVTRHFGTEGLRATHLPASTWATRPMAIWGFPDPWGMAIPPLYSIILYYSMGGSEKSIDNFTKDRTVSQKGRVLQKRVVLQEFALGGQLSMYKSHKRIMKKVLNFG